MIYLLIGIIIGYFIGYAHRMYQEWDTRFTKLYGGR